MNVPQPAAFRGVRKAFAQPGSGCGIIDHASFDVPPGACVSLMGDNGSGKSTLLRIACGLVSPDKGTVRIFGGNPAAEGKVRARIAAMFEGGRALYGRLTPTENVAYFSCMKGFGKRLAMRRFRELSDRFAIRQYDNVAVRKLSRGTQQKFSLICSLVMGADLWLLDEPTLGMDESSVAILAATMREHLQSGGAVLMATHDMAFASGLGQVIHVADFLVPGGMRQLPLSGGMDLDLYRARERPGI
jgi:ABC-2 type transport system ATP-binding protein